MSYSTVEEVMFGIHGTIPQTEGQDGEGLYEAGFARVTRIKHVNLGKPMGLP